MDIESTAGRAVALGTSFHPHFFHSHYHGYGYGYGSGSGSLGGWVWGLLIVVIIGFIVFRVVRNRG